MATEKGKKKIRKVVGAKQKISDKAILDAIKGSGGVISYIAKKLNVGWHTAQRLINRNTEIQMAYKDEIETVLDMCESVLYSAIKEGDTGSAKWYLTQKARHRGYGDKLELMGEMETKININIIGVENERDKD